MMKEYKRRRNIERATSFKVLYTDSLDVSNPLEREFGSQKEHDPMDRPAGIGRRLWLYDTQTAGVDRRHLGTVRNHRQVVDHAIRPRRSGEALA